MPLQILVSIPTVFVVILICLICSLNGEIISVEKGKTSGYYRNVENVNEKVFWVRGYADAFVTLFEDTRATAEAYRIVIGGDSNSWTRIRAYHTRVVNQTSNAVLLLEPNTRKFKPFWIKWTSNSLVLGAGVNVGVGVTIRWNLSWSATIRYISVRAGRYYPVEFILDLSCSKVPNL
ncbi:hypothetical protein SNE40_000393 [Patella caerulea]|uniref:Farnesoic acid O-methyl transferase domain-containing protein n=1 Tax=Patella caerulea TaxID=87958 RepID=A0AAN8KC53_PATCE